MLDRVANDLPAWLRHAPRFNADPLGAARAIRPALEANAAEGERQGRLTETSVRAMADAGLWGLFIPRELGGIEADPETYISVIEEIAYADSAAGWVLMASGFGTAGLAIMLPPEGREQVFGGDQGYIAAGQVAPLGRAEREDGGYSVSGRFQFGSGSQVASWLFGAFVLQENGVPLRDAAGAPRTIWAVAPRSRVHMDETSWDVAGLAATASHDFEFDEQFVPDAMVMQPDLPERPGGAVYAIGVSIAHVSWALGAGMRALDEIKALAARKRRPGRVNLIDQPNFQRDFAEAWAEMEAARALVRRAYIRWHEAAQAGRVDLAVKAEARLAACWATKVAARVGRFAYLAGGSDGARNGPDNRLQRYFRDLHVGATHKHVDDNVMVECATALLGVADPGLVL